jgi:hypothetical protein
MSTPNTENIEVTTDWQEALDRVTVLAKSDALTLSSPLYKSDPNGATSVLAGIYAPGTGPLGLPREHVPLVKLGSSMYGSPSEMISSPAYSGQ